MWSVVLHHGGKGRWREGEKGRSERASEEDIDCYSVDEGGVEPKPLHGGGGRGGEQPCRGKRSGWGWGWEG